MNRSTLLLVVGVLIVAVAGSIWYFSMVNNNGESISDGFEAGIKNWERGFDLPDDPNRPGHKVEWSIMDSAVKARSGGRSLEMYVDGRQDDGTIWVQRSISVPDGGDIDKVEISFWVYSSTESFNTRSVVVAYLSKAPPLGEDSFEVLGPSDSWEGWRKFSYSIALNPGDVDQIWAAFGLSVRWETDITHYFDDVEIIMD